MITKEEIVQTVDGLSQAELEQLAQYLGFIKYQSRFRTVPSFDERQLAFDERQLAVLYAESAEEDREFAEAGISDYAIALAQEDAG